MKDDAVLINGAMGELVRQRNIVPEGVRLLTDIEYVEGGHPRNRLDLYLPDRTTSLLPVVLWVHGGGWSSGDKARSPAAILATQHYAVASINYRYSQDAIFPAQLHDCKAAVRWLRANANEYGLDAARIGAWGGSAGGHLVALLGTTGHVETLEGNLGHANQSSTVQAVVDWFGPTDFLTAGPTEHRSRLLGGDAKSNQEMASLASPITYVSENACPFLIIHGEKDKLVHISQSERFAEALRQADVEATQVTIKDGGHGGAKFISPTELDRIRAFFDKHLQRQPG